MGSSMIIQCQFCQTRFRLPKEKIPPAGTLVRCSSCRATFWVNPSTSLDPHGAPAPPAPGGSPPTPPPTSLPPGKDSDSWWDLPQLPEEPGEATAVQAAPAPNDSWFDLPTVSHSDSAGSQSPSPTLRTQAPPSSTPADDGPTALSKSIFANLLDDAKTDAVPEEALPSPATPKPTTAPSPTGRATPQEPTQRKATLRMKPNTDGLPAASPEGDNSPSIEFLLRDRAQQRQEFWYTAIPLLVRSLFLVGFLFLFAWLWTSLEYGRFHRDNLRWKRIQNAFLGPSSTWKLRNLRYQWRALHNKSNKKLLVIQGTLTNAASQAQPEPDLEIRYQGKQGPQRTSPLRCCATATPAHLHTLDSPRDVQRWQRQQTRRSRQKVPSQQHRTFTLLWLPPPSVDNLKLLVHSPRHAPKAPPRRSRPRSRPASDDLDDDLDDNE